MIVLIGVAAALFSALLTRGLIVLAQRRRWFEATDNRKNHTGDIPFLGGIGIATGFFVAAAAGYVIFLHPQAMSGCYLAVVPLAILMVLVTGVVDDFHNIPALKKLVLQLIAAGIAVAGGVVVQEVSFLGISNPVPLGIFAVPFTLLWIVGISNAINLVDGMDGLAGGISLIAVSALGLWASVEGNGLTLLLSVSLAGAIVGFLVFNLPPAKVFMGDGGALFLGITIAILPLLHGGASPGPLPLPAVLSLLLVPTVDTLAAIIRRIIARRPIHGADREHIHHKLQDAGLSVRQVLAVIYGFCLLGVAGATAYLLLKGPLRIVPVVAVWGLAVFCVGVLYRCTGNSADHDGFDRDWSAGESKGGAMHSEARRRGE